MTQTMPLRVHVEPQTLSAAPLETVSLALSVFNTSDIIDGFDVSLVGVDQGWVQADPDWISLFPDTQGTVVLTLTLPSDFPSGHHELDVKVTSRTTNEVFSVTSIGLEVAEHQAFSVDVDPDTIKGGKRGRFAVTVRNEGNVPIAAQLTADDDANLLNYEMTPTRWELEPGVARSSQLAITAPRPLVGAPATRPFVITAAVDDLEMPATGTFTSRAWIPRWLITLLGIILMLGLWAFILGVAIDAIIEDQNSDLTDSFTEGMESVVEAVAPGAGAGGASGDVVAGLPGIVPGSVVTSNPGTPIPGATVIAIALIEAGADAGQVDPDRSPVEVVSGDDGTFAMEDMIRGAYRLIATAPGYGASDPIELAVPYEDGPIEFALTGNPGLISGVVISAGSPLGSTSVSGQRLDDDTGEPKGDPVDTVTDGEGRYGLDNLSTPGTYEVSVAAPGFTPTLLVVPLAAGQRLVGLEIELAGGAGVGSVSGTVTDSVTDSTLSGVSVDVSGDGGAFSTTTLSTPTGGRAVGSYLITSLPTGTYTATFTLAGYTDVAIPLTITAEVADVTLDAAMDPAADAGIGSISGTATDAATGDGAGGVSVTATGQGGTFSTTTLTDTDVGTYTLAGLPAGEYTVTFSQSDMYEDVAVSTTVTTADPDVTVDAELVLVPGAPIGTIVGTATDAVTGDGAGGVSVTATGQGGTFSTTTLTGPGTDPETGTYTLAGLPAGLPAAEYTYTVTFSQPDMYEDVAVTTTISTAEPDVEVDAELALVPGAPIGTISGTVTDSVSGAPLSGVALTLTSQSDTSSSATLGNGSYEFTQLAVGTYTLTATFDGYVEASTVAQVTAEEREVKADVALDPLPTTVTGTLVVEVLESESITTEPAVGVGVLFQEELVASTDSTGAFTAVVTASGTSELTIETAETYLETDPITFEANPDGSVGTDSVTLFAFYTSTGSLIDELGDDLEATDEVTIAVTGVFKISNDSQFPIDLDISDLTFTSQANMEFTLDLPGPASYDLVVGPTSGGWQTLFEGVYATSTGFMREASSQVVDENVTIPFADDVLWGTLTCEGSPFANTDIGVGVPDEVVTAIHTTTTDVAGGFFFEPLPSGDYAIGEILNSTEVYPDVLVNIPGTPLPIEEDIFCGE